MENEGHNMPSQSNSRKASFDIPFAYIRTLDGVEQQMIEVEPGCYVNAASAVALGLVKDQRKHLRAA